MLQTGTFLQVSDNSGAKLVQCIKVLKKHPKSFGFLGDLVIVSVKSLRTKGNLRVKKKDVCLALIFQTKYRVSRVNSVILLNKALKPYGTRFFGPLFKELRSKKKLKIILLGKDFF